MIRDAPWSRGVGDGYKRQDRERERERERGVYELHPGGGGGAGESHGSQLVQISLERHTLAQISSRFVMPPLLLKAIIKKGR